MTTPSREEAPERVDGREYYEYEDADDDPCPMCHGTGQINALTDQSIIFVASYADCPMCDGSGEAP